MKKNPKAVKDVDIFEGRTILKETDMFFGTDGVHDDKNPENYVFLTPVIQIDTGKKK